MFSGFVKKSPQIFVTNAIAMDIRTISIWDLGNSSCFGAFSCKCTTKFLMTHDNFHEVKTSCLGLICFIIFITTSFWVTVTNRRKCELILVYMNYFLNHTPIFGRCAFRCGSKSIHHRDTCLKKNGLCLQTFKVFCTQHSTQFKG